jgi:uncharacterized protein (DUF1330 family)
LPAFLVGTIRITDPLRWQQYVDRVGATFEPFGGRVVFRGAKAVELNQDAHGERIVVVEFADLAALRRWHESDEYRALIALRDSGADVVLTAYQA